MSASQGPGQHLCADGAPNPVLIADAVSPVRERPILFSAPMVRAILDGRKTQTRRVVKPQPVKVLGPAPFLLSELSVEPGHSVLCQGAAALHGGFSFLKRLPCGNMVDLGGCPYGVPGDLLWVRESWSAADTPGGYAYMADHPGDPRGLGWRPSIHMPRRASRITLRITDVRVGRLNDCSEADAKAEGLYAWEYQDCDGDPRMDGRLFSAPAFNWREPEHEQDGFGSAVAAYRNLWDHINGKQKPGQPDVSWSANPWVWVVTFERETPSSAGGVGRDPTSTTDASPSPGMNK